jgi:hypothetical protein
MRSKLLNAMICTAAVALAASRASAYEPQNNSVAKEKQQAEKKICRWLPVTGSNINQKVCLTEEDWKKAEALSW